MARLPDVRESFSWYQYRGHQNIAHQAITVKSEAACTWNSRRVSAKLTFWFWSPPLAILYLAFLKALSVSTKLRDVLKAGAEEFLGK